jgi:hypothetical protein
LKNQKEENNMGTRSVTEFKGFVKVYQQYDGYAAGVGTQILKLLKQRKLVNGISGRHNEVANGMGCLAALYISKYKGEEAGNIYIEPLGPGHTDYLDFYYVIEAEKDRKSVV